MIVLYCVELCYVSVLLRLLKLCVVVVVVFVYFGEVWTVCVTFFLDIISHTILINVTCSCGVLLLSCAQRDPLPDLH